MLDWLFLEKYVKYFSLIINWVLKNMYIGRVFKNLFEDIFKIGLKIVGR